MSKAEKLFAKLVSGRNDTNFSIRRPLHFADQTRLQCAQDEGQPHHLSTRIELLEFATVNRRKSEDVSGTAGAPRVAKTESQTMMETPMQPDPRDYETRIWYSAEKGDECFVAQVVEWPSIMSHGDTREEAARQIQLALEGALELAAEQGIKPPTPAVAHAS